MMDDFNRAAWAADLAGAEWDLGPILANPPIVSRDEHIARAIHVVMIEAGRVEPA